MTKREQKRNAREYELRAFKRLVAVLRKRQKTRRLSDQNLANQLGIGRSAWIRWRTHAVQRVPLTKIQAIVRRAGLQEAQIFWEDKRPRAQTFENFVSINEDYREALLVSDISLVGRILRRAAYVSYEFMLAHQIPVSLYITNALHDGLVAIDCTVKRTTYRLQINGYLNIIYAFGEITPQEHKKVLHEGTLSEHALSLACEYIQSKMLEAREESEYGSKFLQNARTLAKEIT
jgi:hypothetical protein